MEKKLTKAEEPIMQIIWKLGKCSIGEIRDLLPETESGKPLAHSTVSTLLRILCEKQFIGYEAQGRSYIYHPLIAKEEYSRSSLKSLVSNYFNGSVDALVSFLVKEEDIDLNTLNDLMDQSKKSNND